MCDYILIYLCIPVETGRAPSLYVQNDKHPILIIPEKFIQFPFSWVIFNVRCNAVTFFLIPNYMIVKPGLPSKLNRI